MASASDVAGVNHKTVWIIVAAVLGLALLVGAWLYLPLKEWLLSLGAWARSFGSMGLFLIGALYVIGTLLLIPGFPMTLVVAIIYGWWALAICFLGGMLAAVIAFLLARSFARDFVKRQLKRHPAARALDAVAHEEGFKTILLARLNPVTPFALENYAFGATGARLGAFLLATAVGIVPGTLLNVWIGVTGRTAAQGDASLAAYALLAVGLLAAFGLTMWISRRAQQKLEQERSR